MKIIKKWNGRAVGTNGGKFNIAAYSQKQAKELYKIASGHDMGSELNNYYSPCWGNDMTGIEPINPCIYFVPERDAKPKLIHEFKL